MNLDRDLREALAPLAGDPASDAARVMAALPPLPAQPAPPTEGAPRRPRPAPPAAGWPLPWVVGAVLAALVVGVLGGRWWGAASPGDGAPKPKEEPRREEPKKDTPAMPTEERDLMMLMAFGPLEIDEPGVGVQQLEPGGFATRQGTVVRTGESIAGLYVYANDARVRLDAGTAARVAGEEIVLDAGRVWVSTVTRPTPFVIRAGEVLVESKAVEMQVERHGGDLELLCLQGQLQVRAGGGAVRSVDAVQRLRVAAAGTIGEPEPVSFVGTQTAWMVPMIKQQQDERELQQRIAAMVEAFAAGTYRQEAALELRRFGSRAVPQLYEAMVRRGVPTDEQRQAAELIGSLAEYGQTAWLFALLENDAAEVRVPAFFALLRVGAPRVDDEAFWRDAPRAERERSLQRWRALVR